MSLNKVELARDVPFIEQAILEMEPDAVLCGAALMFKLPPDENGIVNTVNVSYGETAVHIKNFGKATHLIPVEGDLGYFGPLNCIQVVCYHADCPDGFAAAMVAHKNLGNQAEYFPVKYQQRYPNRVYEGGSVLLFLDYCPTQEEYENLSLVWHTIFIIDHHPGAGWLTTAAVDGSFVFDLNHSGAVLTHGWFSSHQPVPNFLRYIEDRDLWKWELEDSRAISAAIRNGAETFERWQDLMDRFDKIKWELVRSGRDILQAESSVANHKAKEALKTKLKGVTVRFVNATAYQSETAEAMLNMFSDVDVACVFSLTGLDQVQISLRAREEAECLSLAKTLGGGGHPRAAGARLSLQEFRKALK